MNGRVVILSDLHLGRTHAAAKSVAALQPLWADATHLVINGDLAEIHNPSHWGRAARATLELFDRCEADDVDLTILSGNHDPYLSDLRYLLLAEGGVFVTHGDVLHPAVAPWSPAAGRIRRAHEAALAALPPPERHALEGRLEAAQHASYAEWGEIEAMRWQARRSTIHGMLLRPWALLQVLHYWRVIPRLAAEFTRQHAPAAGITVVGHTHRAGVWHVGDHVVLNTGSFGFPGRPHAVIVDGSTVSFHRIRLHGDMYRMDEHALARFELPRRNASRSAVVAGTSVA